jgi:hypothetical protein
MLIFTSQVMPFAAQARHQKWKAGSYSIVLGKHGAAGQD